MTEKIKPCPFCGCKMSDFNVRCDIEPRLYSEKGYAVCCPSCDLLFGFDVDYGGEFSTKQEAVEAWNERVNDV